MQKFYIRHLGWQKNIFVRYLDFLSENWQDWHFSRTLKTCGVWIEVTVNFNCIFLWSWIFKRSLKTGWSLDTGGLSSRFHCITTFCFMLICILIVSYRNVKSWYALCREISYDTRGYWTYCQLKLHYFPRRI